MASMYSAKVMEHFANPHNVGEIPDANGVSLVNFMSAVIPLTIFFQSTNQPSARTIRKRL